MTLNREQALYEIAMTLPDWCEQRSKTMLVCPKLNDALFESGWVWDSNGDANTAILRLSGHDGAVINKEAWLAERKRLINTPSRENLPQWARYIVQQPSGEWWAFQCKPSVAANGWHTIPGANVKVGKGRLPAGRRWQDTITVLPQQPVCESRVNNDPDDNLAIKCGRAFSLLTSLGYDYMPDSEDGTPGGWFKVETHKYRQYTVSSEPLTSTLFDTDDQLQHDFDAVTRKAAHLEKRSKLLADLVQLMSDELNEAAK